MQRYLILVGLLAFAVAPLAGQDKYKAPRLPWGDPDLQGVWPSTDLRISRPFSNVALSMITLPEKLKAQSIKSKSTFTVPVVSCQF